MASDRPSVFSRPLVWLALVAVVSALSTMLVMAPACR